MRQQYDPRTVTIGPPTGGAKLSTDFMAELKIGFKLPDNFRKGLIYIW